MSDERAAVRLDPANACLWRGAEAVRLTPKAWAVLALLVEQAGQLVTKETLFATVWAGTVVSGAALVVCIREIRRALGDAARTPRYLETVHRRGYRFIGPLEGPGAGTPQPPSAGPPGAPGAALGREAELRQLHAWLAQAQHGARCVGFVTGDAGIGKTTLVDAFLAQAAAGTLWLGRGQCVELYGAGEAYLPVLEALGQLCRGPEAGRLLALLEQQAPLWLLQLPSVLRAPAREALQRRVQGATPARMLREFAEAVEALTAVRPLVLVLEDLHWSDQATLALVAYLAQRREPARLLLLGTYRPVEVIVYGHPLKAVKTALTLHGHCVDLALEVLPKTAVAAVVAAHLPGHALPPAVVEALYRRTDGHPLFLVQLVEALLRQGALVEVGGRWALPTGLAAVEATVPESVRALIEQQFDGLSAAQQRVLEAASVAGVAWAAAAAAAGVAADAERVEAWGAALARQGQFVRAGGLVEWPDGTVGGSYRFRHALYQQVVYDRVPVGRRVRLHQRIGRRLEAGYGTRTAEIAAELAMHFEHGRDAERAVRYRQQAAEQALRRYTYREAVEHLTTALESLQTLPETPERARHELALQMALGSAAMAAYGETASAVERAYARACALCQQVSATSQYCAALVGWGTWYATHGQLRTARELLEQALHYGQGAHDPADHARASTMLGSVMFLSGEFVTAQAHLEQGQRLYAPQRHRFHALASPAFGLTRLAAVLWHLGYPDQARQRSDEALHLARAVAHPWELLVALIFAASVHQYCRDVSQTRALAEEALALADEQGFVLRFAQAQILLGWALVMQGHRADGMAQLQQGSTDYQARGTAEAAARYIGLEAEAYGYLGDPSTGLQRLMAVMADLPSGVDRYHQAELWRLRGDLLLRAAGWGPEARHYPQMETVEACFRQALVVACRQQAKSLELRATMSLSRLWRQQGKRLAARELLAPIYGWFTEGFNTADLQEAKALLEEMS